MFVQQIGHFTIWRESESGHIIGMEISGTEQSGFLVEGLHARLVHIVHDHSTSEEDRAAAAELLLTIS